MKHRPTGTPNERAFESTDAAYIRSLTLDRETVRRPCEYPPGSTEKFAVLIARYRIGEPLFRAEDAGFEACPVPVFEDEDGWGDE